MNTTTTTASVIARMDQQAANLKAAGERARQVSAKLDVLVPARTRRPYTMAEALGQRWDG